MKIILLIFISLIFSCYSEPLRYLTEESKFLDALRIEVAHLAVSYPANWGNLLTDLVAKEIISPKLARKFETMLWEKSHLL